MKASKLELLTALTDIDPKYLKNSHRFLKPEPKWRILMKKSVKWTEKLISAAVAAVIVLGLIFLPGLWQENTPSPNHTEQPKAVPENSASPEVAQPLRVLADVEYINIYVSETAEKSLKYYPYEKSLRSFEEALEEKLEIADVTVEILPQLGNEREMRLTSLRTEIMSGGGPDVYICPTQNDYQVFPYPLQSVEQGRFLALDDYLSKAQYLDLETFPTAVAEAGQYEGKQYLIPLAFTVPVTLFRESEVQHELSDTMTWDDMLQGSAALQTAASDYCRPLLDPHFFYRVNSEHLAAALMPLTEGGKLTFSEEELLEFINKEDSLFQSLEQDQKVHDYYKIDLKQNLMTDQLELEEDIPDCKRFTAIPVYSKAGGYGALITSFAAVNANTSRQEDAFHVVDYLQSEEFQDSDIMRKHLAGTKAVSASGIKGDSAVFQGLRDHIRFAEFNTPIVSMLGDLIADVHSKTTGVENPERYNNFRKTERTENIENKTTEELVHEAYSKMEIMLGES